MFRKKRVFGIPPTFFDLSEVNPLNNAFAHNDSVYNTPLFDALQLGFRFIEADVHLINDEIFVYHKKPFFINQNKTLANCYLKPLAGILNNNKFIFPKTKKTFYLVLDIKTNAEKTYQKIKETLQPFQSILTSWENNSVKNNVVTIILSGNRPLEMVLSENKRWVTIDGRLEDIGKNYAPHFMPIISDKYSKIFGYSIFSKTPSIKKLNLLQQYADHIHKEGRLFQLWGIPEREVIWSLLLKHNLDLISTDQIRKLNAFLQL